jgi:sigma-B regulation protein RsbU (phosphoserine phosphatase)
MTTTMLKSVDVERRSADRDLHTASQLQHMLLPRSPRQSNGWEAAHHYQPAGVVSGDYLDLVPHRGRLYFMLGDVSGKGIVAALLMAQLHAMFRTLIPFELPMEDLMRRASALLCASSLPSQYATLVFGYVDAKGDVVIANAGHPPPLIIRAGEHSTVSATGLPMGLFCESRFSSTHLTLEAGDTLLLYTDGLTEAENATGDEYGARRVQHAARTWANVAVQTLVEAIVLDQSGFRGSAANADDLSILALRKL